MIQHFLTPAQKGIETLSACGADQNVIDAFKILFARLPDLTIFRPDPEKADWYPCSKTVNRMADECHIHDFKRPNEDFTDIYAWPSTTIEDYKVYGDPPYIIIGRVNTAGFGVIPTADLEDLMDKEGIPFKVVRKIREHLNSRPAIFYM